jgi:hypothetical protein
MDTKKWAWIDTVDSLSPLVLGSALLLPLHLPCFYSRFLVVQGAPSRRVADKHPMETN